MNWLQWIPNLFRRKFSDDLHELAHRLQADFQNIALLQQALSHKSFVNENPEKGHLNNERLEFLGDAVLDLIISARLMREFPKHSEGELSKTRSSLVNERALAQIADDFELGKYFLLGRGEKQSGGARKPSLLANVYEAVVGAYFLDSGFGEAEEMVNRHFDSSFALVREGGLREDYKTQAQELAQSHFQSQPRYVLIRESGPDHQKLFEVAFQIRKTTYGTGTGKSKKEAEQAAAKAALPHLNPVQASLTIEDQK